MWSRRRDGPLEEQAHSILSKLPAVLDQQALLDTPPRPVLLARHLGVEPFEQERVGRLLDEDGRVRLDEREGLGKVEVRDLGELEGQGGRVGELLVIGIYCGGWRLRGRALGEMRVEEGKSDQKAGQGRSSRTHGCAGVEDLDGSLLSLGRRLLLFVEIVGSDLVGELDVKTRTRADRQCRHETRLR